MRDPINLESLNINYNNNKVNIELTTDTAEEFSMFQFNIIDVNGEEYNHIELMEGQTFNSELPIDNMSLLTYMELIIDNNLYYRGDYLEGNNLEYITSDLGPYLSEEEFKEINILPEETPTPIEITTTETPILTEVTNVEVLENQDQVLNTQTTQEVTVTNNKEEFDSTYDITSLTFIFSFICAILFASVNFLYRRNNIKEINKRQ